MKSLLTEKNSPSSQKGCFKVIILQKEYSLYKFLPHQFNPASLPKSTDFISYSQTHKEVSVIAETNSISGAQMEESGWMALYLDAVISFNVYGVLSRILRPLSEEKVSILAISTYETDYILFKRECLSKVIKTMENLHYKVIVY